MRTAKHDMINVLLSNSFHYSRRDVVFVVSLESIKEFHFTEQFHGRNPIVVIHLSSSRLRFALWLDAEHDANGFHDQLHEAWWILFMVSKQNELVSNNNLADNRKLLIYVNASRASVYV
jgi:hypothetical protein